MQSRQPGNGRQISLAVLLTLFVLPLANSQEPTITPNYRDADIRQIVEAVGEVTGKNFILDPRVNAKVTMLSSTPMSPDAFYEAFLSILQVSGYVAMTTGDIIKIIPDATARQYSGILDTNGAAADEIVTQVVQVQNVGASQLVPILRPLIPQYGHLAAHPGSNILIISDRASNVDRMLRIIRRIDQSSDDDIEVVRLEHASASEVVRILTALTQVPRSDGLPVSTSLVSDSRSNSVLIGGDKSDRLRLRALIAHLDTPLQGGGNTQVRYLRYADAEELATKLQQHFALQAAAEGGATTTTPNSQVSVWSDPQNNAIVVNAPPKHMRSLMSIVDKLDIRRAQVLIEAIIVEVIEDRSSDLGVTWAVDGSGSNSAIGITDFPGVGTSILGLGTAFGGTDGVANPAGLIGSGITLGVGRITDSGTSFAAILNALRGDANTNIISTPTIVTTDNEEATLSVGQEVPFLSGSFANTGGVGGGVNPFQTIQREQVGVKLTITPQINEGTSLLLKISQEVSSIAAAAAGAADLITNERTIDTTVIVEDGGILVLGGLVEETLRENDQRVPILGSIPILGNLFRNRSTDLVKTNLMVFIRAKILRDSMQTSFETNAKYNAIRNVQQGGRVELMPGANRPVLPPVESYEYKPSPTTDDATANDR